MISFGNDENNKEDWSAAKTVVEETVSFGLGFPMMKFTARFMSSHCRRKKLSKPVKSCFTNENDDTR